MANQDRPLSRWLIAVLVMNIALLVSLGVESLHASTATRLQLAEMALMGLACLILARALKLSRDQQHRLRKLSDINRLLNN